MFDLKSTIGILAFMAPPWRSLVARASLLKERDSNFVTAPYPVEEYVLDGHRIYQPANGIKSKFHIVYYHGWGGMGKRDQELLRSWAQEKFDVPITIVAGQAEKILPSGTVPNNIKKFIETISFVSLHPRDIRTQIIHAVQGERDKSMARAKPIHSALDFWHNVKKPKSWYDFHFKLCVKSTPIAFFGWNFKMPRPGMRPNYDATLRSIVERGEIAAPRTKAVLEKLNAEAGKVCVVTFSQGAGPGLVFTNQMPSGYVKVVFMVSGSYLETSQSSAENRQLIRIDDTLAETIFPDGDPVPKMIDMHPETARKQLKNAFRAGANLWDDIPGRHALEGQVADFVVQRIKAIMCPPSIATPVKPQSRWQFQLALAKIFR